MRFVADKMDLQEKGLASLIPNIESKYNLKLTELTTLRKKQVTPAAVEPTACRHSLLLCPEGSYNETALLSGINVT